MATETQEVKLLEDLASFDIADKLMVYSNKYNKLGFLPAGLLSSSSGYAARRWNVNNSSPIGEAVGDIDYLRNLPSLLGLGCYLVDNNHNRRKLDPTNHYKFADGNVAALDGSMGHYMWGWGTNWYYSWWVEGNYYYEAASLKPILGRMNYAIPVASMSAIGGGVIDRDTDTLVSYINNSARYRGGNNNATLDGAYNTQLGRAASNLSAISFSSMAVKNGPGWNSLFYAHHAMAAALSRIIFGTRHLQTAFNPNKDANGLFQGGLGPGVSNVNSTQWSDKFGYHSFVPTDIGIDLADGCGEAPYAVPDHDGTTWTNVNVPVFFGYKNMFGLLNKWEYGLIIDKAADGSTGDVYILAKFYSEFNYNSLAGLKKVGTIPAGNGYISQLNMTHLCHKPTENIGSESTYYADYQYNNTSTGLRVSAVGGNANYGGYAGPEYLLAANAPSSVYGDYGSPLCETESDWDTTPVLVV
ncbi:MAG: hypothetical protein PHG58_09660 [Clostridia bacterium]|nr:hypothetical protein [Clostridia bacterium]